MSLRTYISVAIIITLVGCRKNISTDSYNLGNMPEEGIILNEWQVLGPFPGNGKEHFLEVDNLHQFGFAESTITFDDFTNIKPNDPRQLVKNQSSSTSDHIVDFNKLFNYTNATTIDGNVYCAAVLHSDKQTNLKLNFSSDDGSKIWLNHRLIYSRENVGRFNYYDNCVDLDLREGDNLLLIKVNNIQLGWQMFTAVERGTEETLRRFKKTFRLEYGKYFLHRSVVTNNSIVLNIALPQEKFIFRVEASGNNRILVDSGYAANQAWDISALKDGLYSAVLQIRDETFSESFYKGNIVDAVDLLLKEIRPFRPNADTKRNIEALTYRYRHIMKPENLPKWDGEKRAWDKKMIFLFSSFNRYYNNLKNGYDPEYKATGGLLKTYVSAIDDGIQYYQLFVPKNYRKENPLPLVIELPKFMNWHPSPLETNRFANVRLFELFEELADKFNMIILDPGCRTVDKANMNTIDEADLWEAIDDLKKHYNIDASRIYLRGACLSSRSAMKLATKYPGKFAALAMVATELTLSTIDNVYLQQNEPLNYLGNLTNMPIFVLHSKMDSHSPIVVSDYLSEQAQKIGLKQFTYRKIPLELKTYYSEEYMEDIFSFLSKQSLNQSPSEIHFSTSQLKYNKSYWITLNKIVPAKKASITANIKENSLTITSENVDSYTIDLKTLPFSKDKSLTVFSNGKKVFDKTVEERTLTINPNYNPNKLAVKNQNIEGPFSHVFTVPFILVPGTTGTKQETKLMQNLADTINSYWRSRYYNKCRVKSDRDITEDDLKNFSLVLLGTPVSNSIFKRFAKELPVKINDTSIEISENKASGSDLGFYFVYPNPANRKRYIAVIGYNNPSSISLGCENSSDNNFSDVSNYGWYDFKIWDGETSEDVLAGYFDWDWK